MSHTIGGESHESQRPADDGGNPFGRGIALIVRLTRVIPDPHRAPRATCCKRHAQGCTAGSRDHKHLSVDVDRRSHGGEHRVSALGDEPAVRLDDHPFAIVAQARGQKFGAFALDPMATLDRIAGKRLDANRQGCQTPRSCPPPS
jgi:hypothetical protein